MVKFSYTLVTTTVTACKRLLLAHLPLFSDQNENKIKLITKDWKAENLKV